MAKWPLPLKGFSRGLTPGTENVLTTAYCDNVRPRDTLEGWIRLGQRSGLKKAYSQQVGGSDKPVTWLGSVTSIDGP